MTITQLENERTRLYHEYMDAIGTDEERQKQKALDLIDEILDQQIGAEEDREYGLVEDDGNDWDAWMIDNTIDRMREGWDA